VAVFAEKDRKGILGKIKEFVYEKAGWQIPTTTAGKNALLLSSTFCLCQH